MAGKRDWRAEVLRHARDTGAMDLPAHTVEELAWHLEDIYLDAIRKGLSDADARDAASAALAESPLRLVPVVRARLPESRPISDPSAGPGLIGIAGDVRWA